jgi:hypothetical protein
MKKENWAYRHGGPTLWFAHPIPRFVEEPLVPKRWQLGNGLAELVHLPMNPERCRNLTSDQDLSYLTASTGDGAALQNLLWVTDCRCHGW